MSKITRNVSGKKNMRYLVCRSCSKHFVSTSIRISRKSSENLLARNFIKIHRVFLELFHARRDKKKKRQLNWRSAPCESAPTFTVTKAVKLNEIVKKKNKNKNLQADAVRKLNMTTKWITTSGHLLITLQSGTFQLV